MIYTKPRSEFWKNYEHLVCLLDINLSEKKNVDVYILTHMLQLA